MSTAPSTTGAENDIVAVEPSKQEVQRLEQQHEMIAAAMDHLILASLDLSQPGLRILDQATGSGAWLREVRSKASVLHSYVGTDIVDSHFPTEPGPGMSFAHQSMTEDWPADWNETFDLVHSRFALPSVGPGSIRKTIEGLVKLVKPGGYIQLGEPLLGKSWEGGEHIETLEVAVADVFSAVTNGQAATLRQDLQVWLQELGLTDVKEHLVAIPAGIRANNDHIKAISTASMVATAAGIAELTKKIPPISVSRDTLDALPGHLESELMARGGVSKMYVLVARKPSKLEQ